MPWYLAEGLVGLVGLVGLGLPLTVTIRVSRVSPALYLVWQCYAYSQYKVQNDPGLILGKLGPHYNQMKSMIR